MTIVGRDTAGVVVETAESCSLFQVDDEVFYAGTRNVLVSFREVQLVDERIVGRKAKNINFPEAAALSLTRITTCEVLFDCLGASRGVGSVATQIVKLVGLIAIATASLPK